MLYRERIPYVPMTLFLTHSCRCKMQQFALRSSQTEMKIFLLYKIAATPTQSNVFQPFSSSINKCVFIRPIFQWNGKVWDSSEWPTYMMIAFMPQKTNGHPLHQRCTSTTRKQIVSSSSAMAVVTRTKDNDLRGRVLV